MYVVELKNGEQTFKIHGPKYKLKSGNVTKGVNTIDSFSFSILPSNVGFHRIYDYKSLISVYDTNKKKYDFYGRVLYSTPEMKENGLLTKDVICESYFGFLCDSEQEYVTERNWTVKELFEYIVNVHNSQVEDYKRFSIGNITIECAEENIYIGIQRKNTWETIGEKLLDKVGGEIQFRVEEGINYIDYLEKRGEIKATAIKISRNMKSIKKQCDPSEFISRLIPLGCKLTDEEGNETEARLDITSVNGGVNYIEDETAKELYGIRVAHKEFDDITLAANLLKAGKNYLAENNKAQIKYIVKAIDLSLLGLDIDDFEICNYHPIINPLLGIDDIARINKKKINICNPVESTIDIGDNFKSLSDILREQESGLKYAAEEIQSAVNDIKNLSGKIDADYEEIRRTILEQNTTLTNNCTEIVMSALEKYTEISSFEEFRQTVEAQFAIQAKQISMNFSQLTEEIVNVNGDLQSKFNLITKYFTFDINGMTIGQKDNPNKVIIDNDEITITVNDEIVQQFKSDGTALIPMLKITKALHILGYLIEKDAGGNVNCSYVGGDE